MAFSKTPSESTYETKDIKLVNQWETRDNSNTKDNDTVNCYYELIKNKATGDHEYSVTSRYGTEVYGFSLASTNIRGQYYWEDQDKIYVAYDTNIAIWTASTGTGLTILSGIFAAGTGPVGFSEFSFDTNTVKLVVTDGTVLGTLDSGSVFVASTSPDLPVPHLPVPVFLDGYIFIAKAGTADIYNSNLNDPLLWTAGDFISAEMLPDNLVHIARLNNYFLAFGTSSLEYFWDAANATGSPLQRNDTPIKLVGYISGAATLGNKLYFVGQGSTATPELFVLEDFKIDSLGTPPMRRLLEAHLGDTIGAVISMSGHDFYVLSSGTQTYMADLTTKLWTRLQYKQTTYFPIKYAITIPLSSYGYTSLIIQKNSLEMCVFKANLNLDSGVDFTPTMVTDNEYFDTNRVKFGGRLSLKSDRTVGSIAVSWSDDDYQTYSVPRTVVLNQDYPALNALGRFRRRAHKLVHTGNARMRINGIEIDINKGSR
jgi:hypothetical protein